MVQSASTTKDFDRLSTQFGIKGLPSSLLSALSSLSFPTSFPYNFMHLICANLIPNLILLWTGKFKDLDHDGKDYVIMPTVWNAIGEATFKAGVDPVLIVGSHWQEVPGTSRVEDIESSHLKTKKI
jgi:hypothetical protein